MDGFYRGREAYILDDEARRAGKNMAALAQRKIVACATAIRGEEITVPERVTPPTETVRPSGLIVPA